MRKETDLAAVKALAHVFLELDIQPTDHAPVVVSHPFTNSGFAGIQDAEGNVSIADLLNKPEDLRRWRQQIGQYIDQANSPFEVFLLINKPYMLAFLKYTVLALSEQDLGQLLASAWTLNEMPNMDPNISKRELAALFRSVSPEYLMDEGERAAYQALEDTVTADYTGTVSRIALNKTRYVAIFEGTALQPIAPEPEQEADGAVQFNWAVILVPFGLVALAGAGIGAALFIRHRRESDGEDGDTE